MSDSMVFILTLASDVATFIGALVFLVSAIGLLRLPDFFCRLHAPTKAATLGVVLIGAGSAIRSFIRGDLLWLEDLAIIIFLFLTVPVSAQILARAAAARAPDQNDSPEGEDLD